MQGGETQAQFHARAAQGFDRLGENVPLVLADLGDGPAEGGELGSGNAGGGLSHLAGGHAQLPSGEMRIVKAARLIDDGGVAAPGHVGQGALDAFDHLGPLSAAPQRCGQVQAEVGQ